MIALPPLFARLPDWPFGALQPRSFRVIYADPPWSFQNWSAAGESKNPSQHYDCMGIDAIRALPVGDLANPAGCALVMWATSPMLDQQIDILKAWGFTYKAAGAWGKRSKLDTSWAFGPGYIERSAVEFWLIGTIGAPQRKSRSVRNFLAAPVREHSRKPEERRRSIEALWDGPYVELFGRQKTPGWEVWGNQTDKFEAAA